MRISNLKTIIVSVLSFFISAISVAQSLQINVTVTPPYSVHLADYINDADNILLTVTNTSNSAHNFKLISSLTGDNGVSVAVKSAFVPSSAITIQPFETLVLTFNQLQQYNGNITQNDVDIVGYSQSQLIQTEALPEGTYTLCVKAFNYSNNAQISSDFGCATFPITHFDPPVIIIPADNAFVPPSEPQNVIFTWTPSGQPGITNYLFELIDMTQNAMFNPNDAFQNQAVQKYVVQDIITSQLVFGLAHPPLIENHSYAVRVTAHDPQGNLAFKNLGRSPVSSFIYKTFMMDQNDPPLELADNQDVVIVEGDILDLDLDLLNPPPNNQNQIEEDPEDTPGCLGQCDVPMPSNNGNIIVSQADEVAVGKFKMKITSTNGNNSGEGTIFINWLKTPVKVKFNTIKVNNSMQMYSGEVYAKIDGAGIAESIAKNENVDLAQLQNKVGEIKTMINQGSRRISNFTPDNTLPIGLPLALDNNKFDLAIVGIIFKPNTAFINLLLPVQIPEALNGDFLSIHASGICIRPNGMGANGKIILTSNVSIGLSGKVDLQFKKTETYAEFNCTGVTKAHVAGALIFDRDLLLPLNNGGDVVNGDVKATFSVDILEQSNWLGEATMVPTKFTTPSTKGFIFSAQSLKFDHSDLANPQGIDFPNNYPNTTNTWKGISLKNISCQLPDGFQQGNDPLKIEVNNMFIDKYGFTGTVLAQNLVNFDQGKLDGWKFSLDEFELKVLNSGLQSGSFEGDIRIPISETALAYDVTISAPENDQNSVDFECIIEDLPDLEVDMWFAEMALENSTVSLKKVGDKFKVGAILNGDINIGWAKGGNNEGNSVGSFSMPAVEFSGLEIGGGNVPNIKNGSFGIVNNIQANCATFPVNLSKIDFEFNGQQVGVKLTDLGFTLVNVANGLSGSASFTVFGKWKGQDGLYKYEKTYLNAITVKADMVAINVDGSLDLYTEDLIYGNGFRGSIAATIKMTNTAIDLTLQVGKTLGNNGFRYFYFDGLVDLGDQLSIPLGATGVALYGFGGGMWYNMNRVSSFSAEDPIMSDQFDGAEYSAEVGTTQSGVKFTPSKGKLGFNASVLFGIYQARDVFNGDIEFGMQLDVNDLSLGPVFMNGNGYVMQSPTGDRSPESAMITASVAIQIDPQLPMFHCEAGVKLNFGGIVKGGGSLNMHYETVGEGEKLWYFKVGSWNEQSTYAQDYPWEDEKRFNIKVDLKIVKAVFHGYFMTGNQLPGLPPLPKVIRDNLGLIKDDRDPLNGDQPSAGIGMGAGIHVDVDFKFAIFYADVEFAFGADVIIKDFGQINCGGYNPVGINGWYAKGQAYGYFYGDAGLYVNLWFYKGKASLMTLEATAALFAQGPNPMYIKGMVAINGEIFDGLIKVKTSFQVEAGEKCQMPQYNPFEDIPIVSEIGPSDGDKEVDPDSDVQVAFNFPRNKFTISEKDEEGIPKIRSFMYEIKKWELKHGNKVLAWQTHAYAPDGYSRKSIQNDLMPGGSDIDYNMLVKGYEVTGDKKEMASQTYQGTFTTGPLPKTIKTKHVKAMQPMGGKRYVLQDEYDNGYVQLKKGGFGYLFNPGSPATGINKYVARFKVLKTAHVSAETPVTWNQGKKRVEFEMAHNLVPSNIYGIELVRLHTPPINQITSNTNTKDTYLDFYVMGGENGGGINNNNNIQLQGQNINNNNNNNNQLNLQQINNNNNNNQINLQQGFNMGGGQQLVLNANLMNNNPPNNNQLMLQGQIINQGGGGGGGMGMNNNLPLANNPPPPPPPNNWGINNGFANNGGGGGPEVKIEVLNREIIAKTKSQKEEFKIFTYYWKTSKFKSWDEKLATAKFKSGTEPHSMETDWKTSNTKTPTQFNVLYLQLDENIDKYDAYGFSYWIGNNKTTMASKMDFKFEYGNNWLATQWGESYAKPWDAPDPEDWGNPIYLNDEYNEPKAFTLDQFPDFDAYWPEKFEDWQEYRFDDMMKAKPIFDNRNYPVPVSYKGWEDDAPFQIYRATKHGVMNFESTPSLPVGNITQQEVLAAISQAPNPQQQSPPNQMFINNNQGGGGGGMGMGLNMNFDSNVSFNLPILECQDWIAAHDYTWMKEFIIDGISDKLNSYPEEGGDYWNFHGNVYQPILFWMNSDNTWAPSRPSMLNRVILNDKVLEYNTINLY